MKIKTNVKADRIALNHNETVAGGLRVKTNVKTGDKPNQHNQTMAQGLKVKSGVRAGGLEPPIIDDSRKGKHL